jgi:uncharacterized membrane protein (DUF2068 family)
VAAPRFDLAREEGTVAGKMADRTSPAEVKGQSASSRDPGVRVIIAYKAVKGTLWLALASILLVVLTTHQTGPLETIAVHVHHHFTGAWSVALAKLLLSAAQPRHLWFVVAALIMDGVLTLVEGWALHHGRWWGPWLVVVATSSFVPFEAAALAKHVRVTRLIALGLNVAIVVYLIGRARKDRRLGAGRRL